MKKESLIGHIVEVFTIFGENSHVPADAVLRKYFIERKYLGSSDRRDIAVAYYRIVKNYLRLEHRHLIATRSEDVFPELICAADMILYGGVSPREAQAIIKRLPNEFAADHPLEIYEKLGDDKSEAESLALFVESERYAILYSMPEWFVTALNADYASVDRGKMLASLNEEAPTCIRTNTLVMRRDALAEVFRKSGVEASVSPVSPDTLILSKRVNAMEYPEFRNGAFEIQDEASQMVAPMAKIEGVKRVLDACAGAGGKTLHFAALLKNKGEIFATDIDTRKLEELKKRTRRSTAQNIRLVLPGERARILNKEKENWFDVVLLDVPCTGTGTLRRNPSIKWNLTQEMHDELVRVQRGIIRENIQFVKPGGVLLYATCSLLRSESEHQSKWITENFPEFMVEEEKRTRPDVDGCDGFYAARLRRAVT